MTQGTAAAGATFCRYDLRTTDPQAAEKFYSEVAGLSFAAPSAAGEPSMLGVWLLHEQARARGAPPHWLGHIGVTDVEATLARWLERGSTRLSPTVRAQDGIAYAILRDPSGAVFALRADTRRPRNTPVAWRELYTRDLDRAWPDYRDFFGWERTGTHVAGEPPIEYWMFAWGPSGETAGGMASAALRPAIHPHWQFYFPVADLDGALARVHARGGRAIASPVALPNGDLVAPCEDPQGAAFGLCRLAAQTSGVSARTPVAPA